MDQGLNADLNDYVHDSKVTSALRSWADGFGGTVRMPAQSRRARGYTEAFLFTITLDRPRPRGPGRTGSEKLLVKVLPAWPHTKEPGRHELAWSSAPGFAERRLVQQRYHWYPVGDGRHLMFQSVANGGDPVLTLTELADDDKSIVGAVRAVVTSLSTDLNGDGKRRAGPGPSVDRTRVDRYLSRELAVTQALPVARAEAARLGLAQPGDDWVHLDGQVLPNPLRLADEDSTLATHMVDYLFGFAHGDLHGGNVLIPLSSTNTRRPNQFRLIDLSSFEEDAPLSRDLYCLLVTTALLWVAPPPGDDGASRPGLPADQADALLHHLVTPNAPPSSRLLPVLTNLVKAVNKAGLTYAEKDWLPEWRNQATLSLISQALTCMTFDNIDDAGRRWCFRLAAHATEAYRRAHRRAQHSASTPPPPFPPQPRPIAGPPRQATTGSVAQGRHQQQNGPATPTWQEQTDLAWPYGVVSMSSHRHAGSDGPPDASRFVPSTQPGRQRARKAAGSRGPVPFPRRNGGAPIACQSTAPGRATAPVTGASGRPGNSSPATRTGRPDRWRNIRRFPPTVGVGSTLRVRLTRFMVAALSTSLVLLLAGDTVGPEQFGAANRWPGEEPGRGGRGTPREVSPRRDDAAMTTLRRLAEALRDLPVPATQGPYAYVCLRVWSPNDLDAGSDDPGRYQEEQLWWTSQRSGRRSVTRFEGGQRTGTPDVTPYGVGGLTDVPPEPAEELAVLREQFVALHRSLPRELDDAAGTLGLVDWFYRFWPLTPRQRAALLQLVIEMPGVRYRGSYPDRANRPGYAVSADGVDGRRETLIFDPDTGRLLSRETTGSNETMLGYYLFLDATWTETTTHIPCAAFHSPYGQ
ncbi:hypothetical protein GA0070216_11755 [Micromonospora matsumotoense]|uniref:Uncharacterized protein n=1 Tax=Micromonospora matsumotoense TaxID=121616 RepID=A0A1C5AH06_9ACTN|nr:hypothetical protein [Micromonospora matsumotoense]SCF44495.1 hypothetical protein GA0070216_11755 [Micromonospora matsumotoense]